MIEHFFSIALMLLFFIFFQLGVEGGRHRLGGGVMFGCRHSFGGYIFNMSELVKTSLAHLYSPLKSSVT